MRRVGPVLLVILAGVFCGSLQAEEQWTHAQLDFFENRIRPVLINECSDCHGADKAENRFRVDSRQAMLLGGDTGAAVVPKNLRQSFLLNVLNHKDKHIRMPPEGPLSAEVQADFKTWITMGAPWPKEAPPPPNPKEAAAKAHWAFQAMAKPAPPAGTGAAIDRFLDDARQQQGLSTVGKADKRTLIRRASYDLTGLPPKPEEVDAFLADSDPDAYGKLLDRLLASPAYGERWGRHWLDLVRYADTAGNSSDHPIPQAALYRDWVIRALNEDMPYDRFLTQQLAGDILARQAVAQGEIDAEAYADLIVATGFISLSRRFGVGPHQDMHQTIEDTIDTLGRTVMGLTMKCARCHNHKYDPITAANYYALYGIFQSTRYPMPGCENLKQPLDLVSLLRPQDQKSWDQKHGKELQAATEKVQAKSKDWKQVAVLQKEISSGRGKLGLDASRHDADGLYGLRGKLNRQLAQLQGGDGVQVTGVKASPEQQVVHQRLALVNQLIGKVRSLRKAKEKYDEQLERELSKMQRPPRAFAVWEGTPRNARIHLRGDPRKSGPEVPRGFITILEQGSSPVIPADQSGRLQLASWLTGAEHPLTARVMVNRLWYWHFGRGLVQSVSNFGLRGDQPDHAALLDYLARQFVAKGWSMKAMHKQIMLSEAYQLSSGHQEDLFNKDPGNVYLWRYSRRRLEAESIRDMMLSVSGHLQSLAEAGRGPVHPFPPQPRWRFTQHHPFHAVYDHNHRSVYLMTQRFRKHPFFALFDGADPNVHTGQRTRSTVPLQALYMMNNEFVARQAEALAERLLAAGKDDAARIELAFELIASRQPNATERKRCVQFIKEQDGKSAKAIWTGLARVLLSSNEAIFID